MFTTEPGGLSRRRFLAVAGVTAVAAGAAACGGSSSAAQRVLPTDPAVAAAERARTPAGVTVQQASLTAAPTQIDLGGVTASTWAYGGSVPGPEVRVRKGQRLRIEVDNQLPDETSVHWHGLAIRNDMDGVAGLTQPALGAGATQRYEFVVPDAGTYWYHPHVGVQLDRGLYGPLIVENPDEKVDYDDEWVLVLDDWLDGIGTPPRTPDAELARLRRAGMKSMGAMGSNTVTAQTPLGADTGDVDYPYFLINGRTADAPTSKAFRPGTRVRLRVINAGGDSAFRIGMPGQPMTVTHTDGVAIEPRTVDAVILGMGERIDALVTVPDRSSTFVAIPEGKNGAVRAVLSVSPGGREAQWPDQQAVSALAAASPFNTATATALPVFQLPARRPDVTHRLTLAGPAANYAWTINGALYDPRRGAVRQGQRVRLVFDNRSGMFHPMHLHGHTFQVLTDGSRQGPRKDTVLVPPHASVAVDFDADNPGQWLSHCHNVYHGEAGMMTVISYVD